MNVVVRTLEAWKTPVPARGAAIDPSLQLVVVYAGILTVIFKINCRPQLVLFEFYS